MSKVPRSELVATARAFADLAHRGATDHAGEPYIHHPLAVAAALEAAEREPEVIAAALLHDVVEDTDFTLEDLRTFGFPDTVVSAVDAVTYRKGETRRQFIARAIAHDLGRIVKLADIEHNSNPERMAALEAIDPERAARLRAKYATDKQQIAEALRATVEDEH